MQSQKSNEEPITLKLTDYIDKAFKILPNNSFIHKGRCGIGGTHLELKTDRNSILIVPIKSIITDKINSTNEYGELKYPNLFAIKGGVKITDIEEYLQKDIPFKKIIVTPDSLYKIIEAAENIEIINKLYSDFYLILDEAHSVITEYFRESMVDAFELLFNFKNKIIISATPYYFSDPRMEEFSYYRIKFDEPIDKITIINTRSIRACVNAFLTGEMKTKGNLHIFYNSVTEIAEAIELAELKDCNVHCADKEENLEKVYQFFKPQPIKGEYKKVNFYTTSHFEGWNLEDINPTIILVTDVNKPHTKVGISNKGVQAVGRQRIKENHPETKPFAIYHITNHRNRLTFKTLEEFKDEYLFDANWDMEEYNRYLDACKTNNREPNKDKTEFVKRYTTLDKEIGYAKLCYQKTDQFINESACNEEFNHIDYIQQAWENSGFQTDVLEHKQTLEKTIQRKTKKSVKEILSDFETLDPENRKNQFITFADQALDKLINTQPTLYKAYQMLTKEEINSTDYKMDEIKKLLILKDNKDAEMKVLKLLPLTFSVGNRYTKDYIKAKLQDIYNKAGYKKNATAEQLKNSDWYDTKPCKVKDKEGKDKNGFEILRMNFKLRVSTRQD